MARQHKHRIPSFEDGMDLQKNVPYVREMVNAHVYDDGTAVRRKGRRVIDTGEYHSLWGQADNSKYAYAIKNSELVKITLDGSNLNITPLASGFTSDVSFCELNNNIYFVGDTFSGYIENDVVYKLGIDNPILPTKTKSYSPLTNYSRDKTIEENILYCYTYIDSITGEESGTTHLTTTQTNVQPLSGYFIREYRSTNNGETFYGPDGQLCKTMGLLKMPYGQFVRPFKGHLLVAAGTILYWSEPLRYGLYDPATNFIAFSSPITMVEPIADQGVFISTQKQVYYIRGNTMKDITLTQVLSSPAFYKSSTKVKDVDLPGNPNNQPEVVVWLTEYGYMFGLSNGQIINVTYERINIPKFSRANTVMQREDGEYRLISTVTSDILYNTDRIKDLGDF